MPKSDSSSGPELLLASRRCSQCLTTASRIVSGDRAAQIIRDCKTERNHFFCHKGMKGDPRDKMIHCRGVHDLLKGSRAHDFALRFGLPVVEIDPDTL